MVLCYESNTSLYKIFNLKNKYIITDIDKKRFNDVNIKLNVQQVMERQKLEKQLLQN
jgi:hypothetical protein